MIKYLVIGYLKIGDCLVIVILVIGYYFATYSKSK